MALPLMIPGIPMDYSKASKENIVFQALSQIPEDWIIFHSLRVINDLYTDGGNCPKHEKECEIDFLVLVPDLGSLVIEAKAGDAYFDPNPFTFEGTYYKEGNRWRYSDGRPMDHNGPFNQVDREKHLLLEFLEDNGYSRFYSGLHPATAVWLIDRNRAFVDSLPNTANIGNPKKVLTKESLDHPKEDILKLIKADRDSVCYKENPLNRDEILQMSNGVLATFLEQVPSPHFVVDVQKQTIKLLLKEQVNILDFLEEQDSAVIAGGAGTGKTVLAIEKARRDASHGEKTLFLCYNRKLCDHLQENYPSKLIDYYTLDKLAIDLGNMSAVNYSALNDRLDEMLKERSFPYSHVVVDEGQDFDQDTIPNGVKGGDILAKIQKAALQKSGTFYLFYDKNQMVQASTIAPFIADADCRLSLHTNCRNTLRIAQASIAPLKNAKPISVTQRTLTGSYGQLVVSDKKSVVADLNTLLDEYTNQGYTDIVILTAKTAETSLLTNYVENERYSYNGKSFLFTSCRQFKGLEADAIILVDADKKTFVQDSMLFYVGTSRARFELAVVAILGDSDCLQVAGLIKNEKPMCPPLLTPQDYLALALHMKNRVI